MRRQIRVYDAVKQEIRGVLHFGGFEISTGVSDQRSKVIYHATLSQFFKYVINRFNDLQIGLQGPKGPRQRQR